MTYVTIEATPAEPPAVASDARITIDGTPLSVRALDISIRPEEPITVSAELLADVVHIDGAALNYALRDPVTDALLKPITATHILCECGMWWLVPVSFDAFVRPRGHDGHTFKHSEMSVYAAIEEEA
jgi:hypothetical protein